MTPEIDKSNEYSEKSSPENIVSRNVHDKLLSQKRNNELFLRTHIYPKLNVIDESGSTSAVIDDNNPEYSENSSPEKLTEGFMHGKISMDRYNELFRKAYINMIYQSSPTPLKRLGDSIDYKKNQIINKVVGFVKKLGIFEK